jgi:hypothetical protein
MVEGLFLSKASTDSFDEKINLPYVNLKVCSNASLPSVSYNGTLITPYFQHAISTIVHSGLFLE